MPNPNLKLENHKSYKPKWKLGKTQTIRVPTPIAEKVLAYTHQLNEGSSLDKSKSSEVLSADEETEPEKESNQNLVSDTSELFHQKQPRVIISEGLLYPAKEGGKIKTCLARLGILIGFGIEQINRKWILLDTTNEPSELKEMKAIISEGLAISSQEGGKIKTCLAQLGNLLGFKIERKGPNKKWKFTDATDWLKAREAIKSSN